MTAASLVAVLSVALIVWRTVRLVVRPPHRSLDRSAVFLAIIAGALLAARWPSITEYVEYNPDESQLLAQAARFLRHPVPWRDVDGNTIGPLASLVLTPVLALGAPMSWATAHLVLTAVRFVIILLLYLGIVAVVGDPVARLAVVPLAVFYAFTLNVDFSHLSSETVPCVLFAASGAVLAWIWRLGSASPWLFYVTGLFLGAIPLAKLQAAPLAMALGGLAAWLASAPGRRDGRRRWRVIALVTGIASVPIPLLLFIAVNGAFTDFWISYVLSSLTYVEPWGVVEKTRRLLSTAIHGDALPFFMAAALGLAVSVAGILKASVKAHDSRLGPCLGAALTAVAAVYCVWAPGYAFPHYLNLMFPPLILLVGLLFGTVWHALPADSAGATRMTRARWAILFAVVTIAAPASLSIRFVTRSGLPGRGTYRPYPYQPAPKAGRELSPTAREILRVAHPGESVAIWGWMPGFFVETATISGTRDAVAFYAVREGPFQEYYRERFLSDLKSSRPPVFIDAIAAGCFLGSAELWSAPQRHENVPVLRAYVADQYVLWRELSWSSDGRSLRLYVLKERAHRLGSKAALEPGRTGRHSSRASLLV